MVILTGIYHIREVLHLGAQHLRWEVSRLSDRVSPAANAFFGIFEAHRTAHKKLNFCKRSLNRSIRGHGDWTISSSGGRHSARPPCCSPWLQDILKRETADSALATGLKNRLPLQSTVNSS